MRYIIIALFILFTFSAQAQKRNNNTKKSVKYYQLNFEQKEAFLLEKINNAKISKEYESIEYWNLKLKQLRDNHYYSSEKMFKNGFFVDALLGLGFYNSNFTGNDFAPFVGIVPSLRFGNKWSLINNEKSNTSFTLSYLRPSVYLSSISNSNIVGYSILNPGISYLKLFKNNKSGIDLSFYTGYSILSDVQFQSEFFQGFNINPNINIRYKKLKFGLDFLSTFYFLKNSRLTLSVLSFNFGAKF